MTNPNDRCFPSEEMLNHRGLTKREYFAGMAMQGMTSNCYKDHPDQHIAESSVLLADALIEALNKTEK
jgi:hypothetical protein